MKVVVGLGNPGREYENTRHNVGFLVLDKLLNQMSKIKYQNENLKFKNEYKFQSLVCKIDDLVLVKPQTFMNDSGKSVAAIVSFYKIDTDDLYVVHDDLDIVMGEFKIQKAKGPKVHNGVNDIEARLGRNDFWRVRIGVENRHLKAPDIKSQITNKFMSIISPNHKQGKIPGRQYVLMKLNGSEKELLDGVASEITEQLIDKLGL